MDKLKLVTPTIEYKDKAIEFIEEFNVYFSPINGVGGLNRYLDDYEGWLKKLDEDSKREVTEEKVPALTYFLVRKEDDRIVGMINIRLKLNEKLKKYAGHIGYSIRPTERQKGYNKINLYLGLKVLYEHGEENAFLDCDSDNLGSAKTIEALGGKLIREYYNEDEGCMIRDYNINIKESLERYGGLYEQNQKKI